MSNKTERLTNLVVELQNGNEEAFEKLYRKSFKLAYSIAKMMLSNEEDVQDVLQNTYFSISQNIKDLKKPESFESWLGVIVKHECQKYLSKQKRISDIFISAKKSKEFEPPDNMHMPFDYLEKKDSLNAIRSVIDSLPEEKRVCVYLHYFEQHTVAEISEILDIPPGTVVSRLHYSRKKLEKELKKLQKKDSSLFGIGIIPLIVSVLSYNVESITVPAATETAVLAAVAVTQAGTAVVASSAAGAIGGTASASAASAAGTAGAAGAATTAVATKVAVIAVAGTVAASGTVATVNYVQNKNESVTTAPYTEEYTTAPFVLETETAIFALAQETELSETSASVTASSVATTEKETTIASTSGETSASATEKTTAQKATSAPTTTRPTTTKPSTTAPSTTASTTTKPVTTTKPTTTAPVTKKVTTTAKPTTTSAAEVYGVSSGVINEYTGAGGSVAIPSKIGNQTITAIGSSAFEGNTDITSVSLPSTITKIGTLAFSECTNLKSVSLPSSLESIGIGAFYGCTSLTSVTIPDGTETIQSEAFAYCDNLKTVTVPDSVTDISDDAFYGSDVTVRCSEGSAAHEYCVANSVNYELI